MRKQVLPVFEVKKLKIAKQRKLYIINEQYPKIKSLLGFYFFVRILGLHSGRYEISIYGGHTFPYLLYAFSVSIFSLSDSEKPQF